MLLLENTFPMLKLSEKDLEFLLFLFKLTCDI